MWNRIVNPKTGRKVNVNSKIGKSVLRNYMKQLGGAEAALPNLECQHETECEYKLCKINDILDSNNIPLRINIMEYRDLLRYNLDDAFSIDDKDDNIYVVLINSNNNDLVAFTVLNISETCLYINYQFAVNKYRGLSIGVFIGFLAIYIAINTHKKYVFAYGVESGDDQLVESPYKRKDSGDENEWALVLSQAILINKFGFYDGHRLDTYDKNKLFNIFKICGSYAETWLDLHDNLDLYQGYMDTFLGNPRKTLSKYIKMVN